MTSSTLTRSGHTAKTDGVRVTASAPTPETLRQRSDFLKANHGLRQPKPGFLLQARKRDVDEQPVDRMRIGYTCSKKVGNAVTRNRAKRRLRDVARAALPVEGRAGWDYVLIGRQTKTVARPFQALLDDLRQALRIIHGTKPNQ